jgi:hypothetical protein
MPVIFFTDNLPFIQPYRIPLFHVDFLSMEVFILIEKLQKEPEI